MLRRLRKSSSRVTLVLIGVAAVAGCGEEQRRDVYASREDCLADWGRKPEECTPSTDPAHAGRGYYHGPVYLHRPGGWNWGRSGAASSATRSSSSGRSSFSSSSSSSRGGFGSSARSSSS